MNYIEVYFNGALKQSIPITSDMINIGRTDDNDVVIKNMGVSNFHAIISKKNNLFFIEDLNSTNGTFLNSQKITSSQRVSQADTIIIGKHTVKFSEWSQLDKSDISTNLVNAAVDETIIMSRGNDAETNQVTGLESKFKPHFFILRGESTGVKKLLITKQNYSIGKAKDNDIRVGGWFTPAYIANIEKIGHSFYITPLKNKPVKLNGLTINASSLMTVFDEVQIKKLFIKFLAD